MLDRLGKQISASLKRVKTKPVNNPICRPEIASKWAEFECLRFCTVRAFNPVLSSVRTAAAKAPVCDDNRC